MLEKLDDAMFDHFHRTIIGFAIAFSVGCLLIGFGIVAVAREVGDWYEEVERGRIVTTQSGAQFECTAYED